MSSYTSFDEEMLEYFGSVEKISQMLSKLNAGDEDSSDADMCTHPQTSVEVSDTDGIPICKLCGCEVPLLDFQPEWRYYGSSDNRSSIDPSRCHRSKESTRGGITKVFQDAKLEHLPLALRRKAEEKYKQVVGEETVRGKGRKAIVAACLLYVFHDEHDYRTSDEVRDMFTLSRNEMSSGLTRYYSIFPDDRTRVMKPADMIKRTIKKAKLSLDEHYRKIIKLAKCLENVDPTINRSNPQSVAAAVLYLYICITPGLKTGLGITKTKFAKDVKLSDITITKLVKKAAEIIGEQITM